MKKETLFYLKDLFSFLFEPHENLRTQKKSSESGLVSIPILAHLTEPKHIPIHHSKCPVCPYPKLTSQLFEALGGLSNIESYHEIPGSRRIRITLYHPELLNDEKLDQANLRFYLRIGRKIIHLVP